MKEIYYFNVLYTTSKLAVVKERKRIKHCLIKVQFKHWMRSLDAGLNAVYAR